jgi:hypothetical protein
MANVNVPYNETVVELEVELGRGVFIKLAGWAKGGAVGVEFETWKIKLLIRRQGWLCS